MKKEQEKKSIVSKVEYKNTVNTQVNNEGKVQNIIKDIKDDNKITKILSSDISNQSKNLKERLEQRKNKKLLSTSDCTEAIETVKNRDRLHKEQNKSQIITPGDTSPNFNFKAFMGEDDKFEIDTSFDKLELNKEEKNTSGISPNDSYLNAELQKLGIKQKNVMYNLSSSVNNFLDDFMFLFYDQVFQKFYKEINTLNEEKFNLKYELYQKYQSQIAEMELMMREADDHSESIKVIVDNLKEEKENEVKQLDSKYELLINEKMYNFKSQSLKNAPALQTIQEKFKIDMLNAVNDIIYPKQK